MGPHPFPWMVRELQRVVGDEAREQCRALLGGADPDVVVACVGGGSNAAGTFAGFVDTPAPAWSAWRRPAGRRWTTGIPGVLHGMRLALLQDEEGQILEAQSISAGLDYPGDRARARPPGRARPGHATRRPIDDEVLDAFQLLCADRGHHPRPRVGARAGVGGRARPARGLPAGLDRAGDPVGARRQGRGPGPRPVADGRSTGVSACPAPAAGPRRVPAPAEDLSPRSGPGACGRKLLVPYVMGGMVPEWVEVVQAVAAAGADAVEVGIPFSDPMMDGPVIQQASVAALATPGRRPEGCSTTSRRSGLAVPVVVMTYYNLVFRAGHRRMARSMAASGVAGAIVPDLPLEELGSLG